MFVCMRVSGQGEGNTWLRHNGARGREGWKGGGTFPRRRLRRTAGCGPTCEDEVLVGLTVGGVELGDRQPLTRHLEPIPGRHLLHHHRIGTLRAPFPCHVPSWLVNS
jgi:hypothetical protein